VLICRLTTYSSTTYRQEKIVRTRPAPPIPEATFAILLSVADRPRHGYAIMKQVEAFSSGRIRLSTGTLYGALKRFLDKGWISRVEEKESARAKGSGRVRKAYTLTRAGRQVVAAEAARLREMASAAESMIARARLAGA
jgi:DNA-binding PadR family transcriptional regulator